MIANIGMIDRIVRLFVGMLLIAFAALDRITKARELGRPDRQHSARSALFGYCPAYDHASCPATSKIAPD